MTRLPHLVVTAALAATACTSAEQRGRTLYAERGCAACHGPAGRGDGPSARRLDIPPRDLSDVRTYAQGSGPDAIAASIRSGAGAMPPFTDINNDEAKAIAAWIVSLRSSRSTP